MRFQTIINNTREMFNGIYIMEVILSIRLDHENKTKSEIRTCVTLQIYCHIFLEH